jgi:hypothetical protein
MEKIEVVTSLTGVTKLQFIFKYIMVKIDNCLSSFSNSIHRFTITYVVNIVPIFGFFPLDFPLFFDVSFLFFSENPSIFDVGLPPSLLMNHLGGSSLAFPPRDGQMEVKK